MVLAVLFSLFALVQNLALDRLEQHVHLAESLLEGRLHLAPGLAAIDEPARYEGRDYLPLGPAPALLLVPFVAIARAAGTTLSQGWINPVLVAAVFALSLGVARRSGLSREDGLLAAFALVLASPFLAVVAIPIANYFSHAVACLLVLAALYEFLGRNRPWLIGTLLACVLATRLTAGLGVAFFAAALLLERSSPGERARRLAWMAAPVLLAAALLLLYNAVRFGDPLETGYALQRVPDARQLEARGYGLISLRHLPGNLYYLLLALPLPTFAQGTQSVIEWPGLRPGPWGMSLLVTSPWLLWLVPRWPRDPIGRLLLAAAGLVALSILPTWSMGYAQFGYRFALDFLPFLWLALLLAFRQQGGLTSGFKTTVVVAGFVDIYLLLAFLSTPGGPAAG